MVYFSPGFPTSFNGASGFTSQQLYSTASYQHGDLTGINFAGLNLSGWSFKGETLIGSSLANANLNGANFTDADLTSANVPSNFAQIGAILHNTILPTSTIAPLALDPGEQLTIGGYPQFFSFRTPIVVSQGMSLTSSSSLDLLISGNVWNRPLSIQGVSPQLAGTLELSFAPGTNAAALVGTTYNIFEWNGMLTPGQHFDRIVSPSGYVWDTSQLYTTGNVTLTAVPEPATLVMAFVGVVLLSAIKRRGVVARLAKERPRCQVSSRGHDALRSSPAGRKMCRAANLAIDGSAQAPGLLLCPGATGAVIEALASRLEETSLGRAIALTRSPPRRQSRLAPCSASDVAACGPPWPRSGGRVRG